MGIKEEYKKIITPLYVKVFSCLIVIMSVAMAFTSLNSITILDKPDSTSYLRGLKARKSIELRFESIDGEMTTEKLNQVLSYYKTFSNVDEAENNTNFKYPGIVNLLSKAYIFEGEGGFKSLYDVESADDFYRQRVYAIKNQLITSESRYSQWEIDGIISEAEKTAIPFRYGFSRHWINFWKSVGIVNIMVIILGLFMASALFSFEKRCNMDLILVTGKIRDISKMAVNKLLALLTMVMQVYLLSVVLMALIIFVGMGIQGWDSSIQIIYFTSIYNLNFLEATIIWFITTILGIIVIIYGAAFLNLLLRNRFSTLVISIITAFLPLVLLRFPLPHGIIKVLKLFPVNMSNVILILNSLEQFRFGFLNLSVTNMFVIVSMIIIILLIKVIPDLFFKFLSRE